jgi:hypothetical protein
MMTMMRKLSLVCTFFLCYQFMHLAFAAPQDKAIPEAIPDEEVVEGEKGQCLCVS